MLADNTFEAFNFILQILAEYGLIGFSILVWLIYQLVREWIVRKEKFTKPISEIGSFGCIIALMISGLFSNPFHLTPVLFLLCYHLALIYPNTKYSHNEPVQFFLAPFAVAIIFSILVFGYMFNQFVGELNWSKASNQAVYESFRSAQPAYEKIHRFLNHNGDFLFNYGAEASLASEYQLAVKLLENSKNFYSSTNLYVYLGDAYMGMNQFELAEKNYLKAIWMAPSHVIPKYRLIQLYKKHGNNDKARYWALKTLSFPVKVKSLLIDDLFRDIENYLKGQLH
jgi:tetratricopeptide (TPR) repeat protein